MKKKLSKKSWNIDISIGRIKNTDILLFTKHLSVALKSGFTIVEGLEMFYEQAKGRLKKMIEKIAEVVRSGESFHRALANYPKYFSNVYVSLIKMAEKSGSLEENLEHLAKQLKKSYKLRQKVKSALMYPILIFVSVTGLGFTVAIFVLPKILPLFESLQVDLPLSTRVLIFVARLFQDHGMLILIFLIGFTIFLIWFLRKDFVKPVTHRMILRIPVLKTIVKNINLASITRTLGMLLERSIPVDMSLKITAEATNNYVYRKAIESLIPEIEKGNYLAAGMMRHPNLFPFMVSRMIQMGEHTGNMDRVLKYLNGYYENEVNDQMKNLSSTLEPFLLIVIGLLVGAVAISILGPIYKIVGNLRQ